jgi:hypothetical protein
MAVALTDPGRAAAARALLQAQFGPAPPRSLKDLLAAAPLDSTFRCGLMKHFRTSHP